MSGWSDAVHLTEEYNLKIRFNLINPVNKFRQNCTLHVRLRLWLTILCKCGDSTIRMFLSQTFAINYTS